MNEQALAGELAAELQQIIATVDGVATLYPAQPLWQTIAGAARSAVTGESVPTVAVASNGDALTVKARIGVATDRPAPDVVRAVAGAIRQHLSPRPCTVQVVVVQIGG